MERTRIYLTESLSGKERNRYKQKKEDYSILDTVIKAIGYLIIVTGIIIGGYMLFTSTGVDLFMVFLLILSTTVLGVLIIGFARIIYLLTEINNKLKS